MEEEHVNDDGQNDLQPGGVSSSTAGSSIVQIVHKPRETSQWPSESTILVAVRVRPFSPAEQALLPRASTNKFNFSADASLSSGFGSVGHGRPGDLYNMHSGNTSSGAKSSGSSSSNNTSNGHSAKSIRKIVDVLDDNVLVFDPPDAESISKYKRALLPVQAYRRFKDMRYAFDRVFHEDSQQQEVFENTTRHLIDGVLSGYNGTLFAYGATGCGKTHTISGTPEKPGIIFLTMQELYERIKEVEDEKTIEISVSYLEVYNETIRDLLVKPSSSTPKNTSLHLREDSSRRVTIAGLSEHHPKGIDALMELVFMGNENRTMSPTEANATSSRSHAVLQINICQRLKTADVSEDFTMATLSLIDLAGSERASATKNRGSRLIEGANINKSLLALGNCINALCENKPKSHIPYRDSKLTRLLKFSLGGNCKTVMIACVSPSSQHYEETHNTLKYANRAKNIKTKLTKNTLNVDRHVSEYVQAIFELRQEVADLKRKLQQEAKAESREKAHQRHEQLDREFDETVRKMRATFQTARSQESTYAQLQSQLFIASARLSGLYRWRKAFDEASGAAKRHHERMEQERELSCTNQEESEEGTMAIAAAAARAKKLQSSLSASSSYTNMVDQMIQDLNTQIRQLTEQMQEHEDALKMYAVSIQSMENKDSPILNAGFPFQRLYELEKKCQVLESHNKILTKKLELSDKSLSEQFLATEDFMELSARSLVGLRPEIETIEQAGLPTKTLNDIYMASITSFTDMTKRVGSFQSYDQRNWNSSGINRNDNSNNSSSGGGGDGTNSCGSTSTSSWHMSVPSSPFKRDGAANFVGLDGSRMMSILPEVPSTPVKRRQNSASHVLPNLSMDTVDTNLALGSSSLFGSQSPVRIYHERTQMGSGNSSSSPQNPFQVTEKAPFSSLTKHRNSIPLPRRKSIPMTGVVFSPKRRRPRGGLRQPRLAPTPTKRSVNFLLDIVDEDEERYTTGLRDPSAPIIRPTPFPSLSSLKNDSPPSFPPTTGQIKLGMGGGAKRLAPVSNNTNNSNNSGGNSNSGSGSGSGGTGNSRLFSNKAATKGETSKGLQSQRVNSSSSPSGLFNAFSSSSQASSSPSKRPWSTEKGALDRNTKRAKGSPLANGNSAPIFGVSAATAARIARRMSSASASNQAT
ncbi:P-loop containing nucleoside triphosphate hydrolase protein [Lobosporangium transversale]|uniref:p-loop containing nucleoside triphosphate hydrolase protein n=1 Tax=Lobosporangium transversale TaxID=64571 RepID=A0A1Y2GD74_9FUNG|nr:P-loop containing nucleoside triphosphate hydrolase protein [Lobosporangium transversale]ORZ06570.1 P-loop containing nucleoside triphosphate hydrolase protein [Lobosporangium transversale]|eukprot:XP_021877613.1 P-loop containing nucleoside triphosphate hydrolase protein [Lobosporangium transversale]